MSSDPKYIGPGYWTAWHIKSLHADDKNKKSEVARSIVVDIIYFPCMNCRNHAKDYVRKNPLMEAIKKAFYGTVAAVSVVSTTRAALDLGQDNVSEDLKGGDGADGIEGVQNVISSFLGLVALIAVIMAIYGGFLILTGGANEENVAKGRKTLLYAIVGIIVIFLSWSIISLVFNALDGAS